MYKKLIPLSYLPPFGEALVACCSYKSLHHLGNDLYLLGYYNTATHWTGWEVARDKYNSLTAVKR